MKYIEEFREHFSKQAAFSIDEVMLFLRSKNASISYIYQLIHYLLKKHELKRISRGFYTFHDDVSVVGFAFKPFYYGLEDALSIHGLWEQETNPIVITTRKVRTGIRSFEGRNYIVRHIAKEMFFGYELVKHSGFWLPVATVEKTLIDFLYFKIPIGKELTNIFRAEVDGRKMEELIRKIPEKQKNWILKRLKKILGRI